MEMTADRVRTLRVATGSERAGVAPRTVWIGRALSALAILFLALDGGVKVLELAPAVEATRGLGFPASAVFGIGLVELACLLVFVVPRSAIVGAVLLTGYLGGAIAANVRQGNPLLSHTLFPIYVAILLWGGLYLRSQRLRIIVALLARETP